MIVAGGGVLYSEAPGIGAICYTTGTVGDTQEESSLPYDHLRTLAPRHNRTLAANRLRSRSDLIISIGTVIPISRLLPRLRSQNKDVRFININVAEFDSSSILPSAHRRRAPHLEELVASFKGYKVDSDINPVSPRSRRLGGRL